MIDRAETSLVQPLKVIRNGGYAIDMRRITATSFPKCLQVIGLPVAHPCLGKPLLRSPPRPIPSLSEHIIAEHLRHGIDEIEPPSRLQHIFDFS